MLHNVKKSSVLTVVPSIIFFKKQPLSSLYVNTQVEIHTSFDIPEHIIEHMKTFHGIECAWKSSNEKFCYYIKTYNQTFSMEEYVLPTLLTLLKEHDENLFNELNILSSDLTYKIKKDCVIG